MYVPRRLYDDLLEVKTVEYEGFRLRRNKLLYAAGYTMRVCAASDDGIVKLYSEILRKEFGTKYNHYFDYLVTYGLIKKGDGYFPGKSKDFSIADWAWEDEMVFIEDEVAPPEVPDWVKHGMSSLEIDRESALEWLNSNTEGRSKWHNLTAVNDIADGKAFMKIDPQGRLHTNFTILKKYVRKNFCKLNGEQIVEVDIKNAQPMLAMWLARKDGLVPDESYMYDIVNGTIYESLFPDVSRAEAKRATFVVMFGRNTGKSKADRTFAAAYPRMYGWMAERKRNDYAAFARKLQRLESELVLKRIVGALYDGTYPILTIHDSVHVPKRKGPEAKSIVREIVRDVLGVSGDVLTVS